MAKKLSKRIILAVKQNRREQSLQLQEKDPEPEKVYEVLAQRRSA